MEKYREHDDDDRFKEDLIENNKRYFKSKTFKELRNETTESLGMIEPIDYISASFQALHDSNFGDQYATSIKFMLAKIYENRNSIGQLYISSSNLNPYFTGSLIITTPGNITSSGNISSSGIITANSFTATNITASGHIVAGRNIYSDNIEVLAQGSARVSSITNTTDYWGPNFQGPYHTANWNKNVTPESDGNVILERQKANTGFIVPYSCSLLGFDAIGSMNSGENTHFSMSLFKADALSGMNLNNSSGTAAGFTASLACTGISQGNRGYNRHRMTSSCNVVLTPFDVVFPLVKIDAAGNDDSAMAMDMTYIIKIKRIK